MVALNLSVWMQRLMGEAGVAGNLIFSFHVLAKYESSLLCFFNFPLQFILTQCQKIGSGSGRFTALRRNNNELKKCISCKNINSAIVQTIFLRFPCTYLHIFHILEVKAMISWDLEK
jgi:hypothetical protein